MIKASTEKIVSSQKNMKVCPQGHQFTKSSDCPVCPICEAAKKPDCGFLSLLGAPARRALERIGVTTLELLSKHIVDDILQLHGMGPASIPTLIKALAEKGLSFNQAKMEPFVQYHRDGSLWAKGYTLDGVRAGYWQWFRKDGVIMRSGYFEDDKQVGQWITFDNSGAIYKTTIMKSVVQ
jgi:hypothetical protein